jgi:putative membrane protein
MIPGALLAGLHHVLAFVVVALLAAELALLQPGRGPSPALGRIDLAYGLGFGLLVVIGLIRAAAYEKGLAHYAGSAAFWAKIALLLAVTGLSLPPTFAYLRWGRARRADPAFRPAEAEVLRLRRFLWAEAALLGPVPVLAALMARGF